MTKVRKLTDREFLHLLRIAAGLLTLTDGDLRTALAMAMEKHRALLNGIANDELRVDVGPGDVVLFVPEAGGLALRTERHPRDPTEEVDPTEEAAYEDIDLLGFEVIESTTNHVAMPRLDAGVIEEWD